MLIYLSIHTMYVDFQSRVWKSKDFWFKEYITVFTANLENQGYLENIPLKMFYSLIE